MKTGFMVGTVLVLTFSQVVLGSFWPFAIPQLGLCFVVIASMYTDYAHLLWLSLLVGLILDIFGAPGTFGIHIAYLLLTAIVVKLMLRPEDQTMRLGYSMLLIAVFGTVYNMVSLLTIIRFAPLVSATTLSVKLIASIIYNSGIAVILFGLFESVQQRRRIYQS